MTSVGGDPNDRSTLAKVATATALVGGVAKGLVFDRPRIALALPHAREQGKVAKWALELASGHATNDIVPITGGTIRLGGRVLTTNAWRGAYTASNALTLGLVGVHMLYGVPNLVDGWQKGDGPGGLLESRAGRTGVAAAVAGLVEIGLFTYAGIRSPGSGMARATAALHHPIHSNGATVLAKIGLSMPVLVNEAGFLDFLNAGDRRDAWTTARDTVTGHLETAREFLPGG